VFSPHNDTVHGITWINETTLITGCESGTLLVHDIRSSSTIGSFFLPDAIQKSSASALRSICCLSSLSTLANAETVTSWGEAIIGIGCVNGYACLLYHNQLIFDSKLHSEDIRSLDLLSYSLQKQLTGFSSFHEVDLLTSSYDMTSSLWKITSNEERTQTGGNQVESKYKMQDGHCDKNLTAIMLKQQRENEEEEEEEEAVTAVCNDVITTGADGKVMLWMKQ
jgi:hypothetical protein